MSFGIAMKHRFIVRLSLLFCVCELGMMHVIRRQMSSARVGRPRMGFGFGGKAAFMSAVDVGLEKAIFMVMVRCNDGPR